MVQLTRILALATVGVFVAISATNFRARAEEPAKAYSHPILTADDCHQQRRALSRRACQARLRDEMHIETAEKN